MRRKQTQLAGKTAEMMFAVPQVIAHRTARMLAAGHTPSRRDQREFMRMGSEKVAAANEAWRDMGLQLMQQNQKMALSVMQAWWQGWAALMMAPMTMLSTNRRTRLGPSSQQLQRAATQVLSAGLAPVHRRAVANAKRLGRSRRR